MKYMCAECLKLAGTSGISHAVNEVGRKHCGCCGGNADDLEIMSSEQAFEAAVAVIRQKQGTAHVCAHCYRLAGRDLPLHKARDNADGTRKCGVCGTSSIAHAYVVTCVATVDLIKVEISAQEHAKNNPKATQLDVIENMLRRTLALLMGPQEVRDAYAECGLECPEL